MAVKKTRIKLHGKESPLVNIGKHLGMFEKDKAPAIPVDAVPVPQRPPEERLAEMRKRFDKALRSIEGGKQD